MKRIALIGSNCTEATRRFIEALVGGRTRWREDHEQEVEALGVPWFELPLKFRRAWWRATDRGRHLPLPGSELMLLVILAAAQIQLKTETDRCEIAAATARACEVLDEARQSSCFKSPDLDDACLRPASPCRARCLRALFELLPPPPESEAELERLAAWKAAECARNAENVARWARQLGHEDIAVAIEAGTMTWPDAARLLADRGGCE
jgi:hypothetical protein